MRIRAMTHAASSSGMTLRLVYCPTLMPNAGRIWSRNPAVEGTPRFDAALAFSGSFYTKKEYSGVE